METKINFPKNKKELKEIVEKHGEIRLYISNGNGIYAYSNKISKDRLDDEKIYWIFDTTNNYFSFCHKCCEYINGDHHCYNDDYDKVIDANGQIKDYNWPCKISAPDDNFRRKSLRWIDKMIEKRIEKL